MLCTTEQDWNQVKLRIGENVLMPKLKVIQGFFTMPTEDWFVGFDPTIGKKYYGWMCLDFSKAKARQRIRLRKGKERAARYRKILEKNGMITPSLKDDGLAKQISNWRKLVIESLGGLCWCGQKAKQVHHIFQRAYYPEMLLVVNNGIPLCKQHHLEVHGKKLR